MTIRIQFRTIPSRQLHIPFTIFAILRPPHFAQQHSSPSVATHFISFIFRLVSTLIRPHPRTFTWPCLTGHPWPRSESRSACANCTRAIGNSPRYPYASAPAHFGCPPVSHPTCSLRTHGPCPLEGSAPKGEAGHSQTITQPHEPPGYAPRPPSQSASISLVPGDARGHPAIGPRQFGSESDTCPALSPPSRRTSHCLSALTQHPAHLAALSTTLIALHSITFISLSFLFAFPSISLYIPYLFHIPPLIPVHLHRSGALYIPSDSYRPHSFSFTNLFRSQRPVVTHLHPVPLS